MSAKKQAATYLANRQDELDSAWLYRTLAELSEQEQLKTVYNKMATVEESHAHFWENKLKTAGFEVPPYQTGWRTRMIAFLARRFGPGFVLSNIVSMEQAGSQSYDNQPEAAATKMPQQERSHARLLKVITSSSRQGMEGSALAQLEGRHRASGGNALRAAVLGADDGLVSNMSLVMGVAGADLSGHSILVTGLAGLLAGACSMALGEWLSVQSARELYQRQIKIEQQELNETPEEEQEELALIYEAKGLPAPEARALAAKLISDHSTALDTLSREELGIDPKELGGSAWVAAGTSFMLFAFGAIIPVFPFFFLSGPVAVIVSLAVSALALFLIGAGITLLTGRGVLYSGVRQVIFGLIAAAITFGIGRLIGVSLGG